MSGKKVVYGQKKKNLKKKRHTHYIIRFARNLKERKKILYNFIRSNGSTNLYSYELYQIYIEIKNLLVRIIMLEVSK